MHDTSLALHISFNKQASKEKLESLELNRYSYGEKRKKSQVTKLFYDHALSIYFTENIF